MFFSFNFEGAIGAMFPRMDEIVGPRRNNKEILREILEVAEECGGGARNEEVLRKVGVREEITLLEVIKKRKRTWLGYFGRRDCLLKGRKDERGEVSVIKKLSARYV